MVPRLAATLAEILLHWRQDPSPSDQQGTRRTISLALDLLEERSLLAFGATSFEPTPEPNGPDDPSAIHPDLNPPTSIAPTSIDITDPTVAPDVMPANPTSPPAGEPDPSTIPVEVGPGENVLVSETPTAPNAIDVISGMIAMIVPPSPLISTGDVPPPTEPTVLINPPALATPGPEIPMRSRPSNGTAGPEGSSFTSNLLSSNANMVDAALSLPYPQRNQRIADIMESLSNLPADTPPIDPAVTDWLRAEEVERLDEWVILPMDMDEHPDPDAHADETPPLSMIPLAALGLAGAVWSGPRSTPRSTKATRGNRDRTPVEYYGSIAADGFEGESMAILVRDLSSDGVGILHHGPLPARRVTIIFGDSSWSLTRRGIVRWTRRLGENVFASGISFQEIR
ncbi:hypothetical protein K2X85_06590 [bacterium]|nr:hypothetical protein [bacterium]